MIMRRNLALAVLFLGVACQACSDKPEGEPKKGGIAAITSQAATDIGNHIRRPLDKARAARSLQEDRLKEQQEAGDDG